MCYCGVEVLRCLEVCDGEALDGEGSSVTFVTNLCTGV